MTATKYESAKLILELYDLRREAKMREARDWWYGFKPKSYDEITAVYKTADSAKFRMVMGYWEMACTLVMQGAIDETMFNETNGEHIIMFLKLQPFLAEMRAGHPSALKNTEAVIKKMPNSETVLAGFKKMLGM